MERYNEIIDKTEADNAKVFTLLSNYLNHAPDFIDKEEIDEIIKCGVSTKYAFAVILADAFGLDIVDHILMIKNSSTNTLTK
jgi:nicotinamidase-related amidase